MTDEDGSSDMATLQVSVGNLGSVVEAGPDRNAAVGETLSLAYATFSDAGTGDTHGAEIDWGDGTIESGIVSEPNGSGSVAGSHSYDSAGNYTVTDDDGDVGSDALTATVESAQEPEQTIFDLRAAVKSGQAGLSWTVVAGADSCNICRGTGAGGPYQELPVAHTRPADPCVYIDYAVTNGVTYYYVATSVSGGLESLVSNEVSATPTLRRRRQGERCNAGRPMRLPVRGTHGVSNPTRGRFCAARNERSAKSVGLPGVPGQHRMSKPKRGGFQSVRC